MEDRSPRWPRRKVLACLGTLGIGGVVFRRALVAFAQDAPAVTKEMLARAEWVSGLSLTDEERELMLAEVNRTLESFRTLREIPIDNAEAPAVRFETLDAGCGAAGGNVPETLPAPSAAKLPAPTGNDDFAFATVAELAAWLRAGRVTSSQLTQLALYRMLTYDPTLACVVSRTERRGMEAARAADAALAEGRDLGPLHGIPWGAKDLLAVPGYPTTWGATPTRVQVRPETAAVVERLDAAGCPLAAKLTLGALAWGDVWYGGTTKNPWNVDEGSSGSSAGSASAVAAGLVPFAIGSETYGSIVSPATRCGVTGLRPTFGRVSRYGAMALSWTMDKLGPMARSAEDCALVFREIHGADPRDPTAVDRPFAWPCPTPVRGMKVGYDPSQFEVSDESGMDAEARRLAAEWRAHNRKTLEVLEAAGARLVEWRSPDDVPVEALSFILTAEAATAFDAWTRDGRDDELVRQEAYAWPNFFRVGQTVSAVEYLRANRLRGRLMRRLEEALGDLQAWVSPPFAGSDLLMTNLTGHPCVVLPNGVRAEGTPTSIVLYGRLFGESEILALAQAFQSRTRYHRRRPVVPIVERETP